MGKSWSREIRSSRSPAIRAPRIGSRSASDQNRIRKGPRGSGRRRASRAAARDSLRVEGGAGSRRVVVSAQEDAGGRVGALAGRDDVLRGAAEEQPAQQVEAVVEVEVHRDARRPARSRSRPRADDRHEAAGEAERAVGGVDEPEPGVHVGGLDLCAAPAVAKPRREPVRRPPLGVGSGQPALERAQLADHFHAARRHPRAGDYRGATGLSASSLACGGWDSNPQALSGSGLLRPPPLPVWTPPRALHCAAYGAEVALPMPACALASKDHVRALHADRPRSGADPGALRPRRVGEARGGAPLQHRADRSGAGDPPRRTRAAREPDGCAGAWCPGAGPSAARARR